MFLSFFFSSSSSSFFFFFLDGGGRGGALYIGETGWRLRVRLAKICEMLIEWHVNAAKPVARPFDLNKRYLYCKVK